jgi:hypothetical protein
MVMGKFFQNFKEFSDSLDEAKGMWQVISDTRPTIARFSGKTWPQADYSPGDDKIYARDNNGSKPYKTYSTDDISIKGLQALLNQGISKPHPSLDIMKAFIDSINKIKTK